MNKQKNKHKYSKPNIRPPGQGENCYVACRYCGNEYNEKSCPGCGSRK